MLLSHISAYLVLGLLSTVQAAPTPGQSQSTPATTVTDVSDHDPELSDWEIVIQTAKCVQYLGLSVCGPFVTRVDFDNNKPISERRFTVEEADVPEKVWQKIKEKKSENFHDFPYPAPLQFSARWPSDWSKYPEHPNLKSPKIPPAFVLRTYGYHDDGSKSPKSVPATMSVHTPAFDPPPSSKPQTSEQSQLIPGNTGPASHYSSPSDSSNPQFGRFQSSLPFRKATSSGKIFSSLESPEIPPNS